MWRARVCKTFVMGRWPQSFYAGLAIKASFALGESRRAEAILQRALTLCPADIELAFLQRIAANQRMLTAELR